MHVFPFLVSTLFTMHLFAICHKLLLLFSILYSWIRWLSLLMAQLSRNIAYSERIVRNKFLIHIIVLCLILKYLKKSLS